MDRIERAKELFRVLEDNGRDNSNEDALRAFTIQDRLAEIKKIN